MSEEHTLEEQPLDPRSVLQLYQLLGRIESTLQSVRRDVGFLRNEVGSNRSMVEAHLTNDATVQTEIKKDLSYLKSVVERIRQPVDTFLSLRNFLIGAATLVAAVGAVFYGAPQHVYGWLVGLFHGGQ